MSYITVSAEKVITAAQSVIDRIMARREEKDDERIKEIMTKKRYRFFFLKVNSFTREEAIKYLDEYLSDYISWRSQYAWGDLDKAKILITMAKNGDPVNISNDDAKVLWGYNV